MDPPEKLAECWAFSLASRKVKAQLRQSNDLSNCNDSSRPLPAIVNLFSLITAVSRIDDLLSVRNWHFVVRCSYALTGCQL